MKRRLLFGLLILALVTVPMFAIACEEEVTPPGEEEEVTPPGEEEEEEEPQYGGTLKLLVRRSFDNLGWPASPVYSLYDWRTCRPAIEGLTTFQEGILSPLLATSWDVSPDAMSITFTLREGVKFHDGTNFNAAAAKYCLDMVKDSTLPDLQCVESVDALDDYTIQVNFLTPQYPSGIIQIIGRVKMVSPTFLESLDDLVEARTHPVGTGPFKFDSYERDVVLKYVKFDEYWQEGKPYLDGIDFMYVAEDATRMAAFRVGEGDVLFDATAEQLAELEADPSIEFNVYTAYTGAWSLWPDSANPDSPFADVRVRRAMAYAIDREAISTAWGCVAANQIVHPSFPTYSQEVVTYPYDPQKAIDLLAEVGIPAGTTINLNYVRFGASSDINPTAMQAYINEVGLDCQLNPLEPADYIQQRKEGWSNGMLTVGMPAGSDSDMVDELSTRLTSLRTSYASVAIIPEIEAILDEARAEFDKNRRDAIIRDLWPLIHNEYCLMIPIYWETRIGIGYLYVHNLDYLDWSLKDAEWHPENVWLGER